MNAADIREIAPAGVPVRMIANGDRIVAHFKPGDDYEPESLAEWARLCRGGGRVLDCGAYSGLFAIVAEKCGATVMAFECNPPLVERLRGNRTLNACSFEVLDCAVSDRCGKATLRHNPNSTLTTAASLYRKVGEKIEVSCLKIDAFGYRDVRAIKLDVERHEPEALRGARETIAATHPPIIMESLDDETHSRSMAELPGYRVVRRMDKRNVLLNYAGGSAP